jgi:hypothetical protein
MTKVKVLGDLPIIEPSPPAKITDEDCDRTRLLLAYGLTRDEQELLEPRLPSQIGELPIPRASSPEMTGPEHM